MKNFILIIALFICATASAQLGNGFYRVHNYKTGRYVYVYDNTGGINISTTSADMGAIQLWEGHSRTISDPASIIYAEGLGNNIYNLHSQGTSVYEIINYNVKVYPKNDGTYQLYAEGKYLADDETSDVPDGQLGTIAKGDYRKWVVTPVDTEANYFGISPNHTVGDKNYKAFYADFAFSFASSGMKAYYISETYKHIAVIKEINDEIIAANTPVIIECNSADAAQNKMNLYMNTGNTPSDNKLKGVYFNNKRRPKSPAARTKYDAATMRVLGITANGELGFITSSEEYLAANEAYLIVPAESPNEMVLMTEEELNAFKENENAGNGGGNEEGGNGDNNGEGGNGDNNGEGGNGDGNGEDGNGDGNGKDGNGDGNGEDGNGDNNGEDGNGDGNGEGGNGDGNGEGGNGDNNGEGGNGDGNEEGGNGDDNGEGGNGDGTKINSIKIKKELRGVFSLTGRKIAEKVSPALPKGIYIVNGKKYIKIN